MAWETPLTSRHLPEPTPRIAPAVPENAAAAVNTSGYRAASTLVIIAPEEKPLTTMRAGSMLWRCRAHVAMDMIPVESPPPSRLSAAGVETSKQRPSRVASGTTTMYPYRSAAVT